MMVLALDPATVTGWACSDGEEVFEHGTHSFKTKPAESNGVKFIRFRKWLNDAIEAVQPDLVVYERSVFSKSAAARDVLVGFQTRIEEVCAGLEIEYAPVATAKVKKFISGSGKASKEEVAAAVRKRYGFEEDHEFADDNESDALAVLAWASEQVGI